MTVAEHSTDVAIEQLDPQPVLSIRATVQIADLVPTMDDRMPALLEYLQQQGAQAAGPLFVRYHTFGETETDIETGLPVVAPVAGEGRIAAGELPGGPAVSTWHLGPHNALGEAYARLADWLQAHERESAGPSWEIYYWIDPRQPSDPTSEQDPTTTWRIQLVQPFK